MLYEEFFSHLDERSKQLFDRDKNLMAFPYFEGVITPVYNKLDLKKDVFCLVFTKLCYQKAHEHMVFLETIGILPYKYFTINYEKMSYEIEKIFI